MKKKKKKKKKKNEVNNNDKYIPLSQIWTRDVLTGRLVY